MVDRLLRFSIEQLFEAVFDGEKYRGCGGCARKALVADAYGGCTSMFSILQERGLGEEQWNAKGERRNSGRPQHSSRKYHLANVASKTYPDFVSFGTGTGFGRSLCPSHPPEATSHGQCTLSMLL